jgi:hypothetical protein
VVHDPLQTPKVNTDLVTLISHDMFIPPQFLPTFNSHVIESYLHLLPGVSECFVYMNDDFYFSEPVERSMFMCGIKPHMLLGRMNTPPSGNGFENQHYKNLYHTNILLNRRIYPREDPTKFLRYRIAHTAYVFKKSICEKAWGLFRPELQRQSEYRFRRLGDISDSTVVVVSMLYPWVGIEFGMALPTGALNGTVSSGEDPDDPILMDGMKRYPHPSRYEL